MRPIPELTREDMDNGIIDFLPTMEDIPAIYPQKRKFEDLFNTWFFSGLPQGGLDVLEPKEGVDKLKALRAIRTAMTSWKIKHEHKEEACAFLMSEWFTYKAGE